MNSLLMNFSGVFADEGWDAVIASQPGSSTLDLSGIEGARRYCDTDAQTAITQAIAPHPLKAVHWIDTGDYHYLTALWLRRLTDPVDLLLLDNHPDDQAPAFGGDNGLLSCGSWMLEARANPLVRRTLTLGVGGSPYASVTKQALNVAECPQNTPAATKTPEIVADIPLYISIDLDVLGPDYFRANWNQGTMSLDGLFAILDTATKNRPIAGIDICGGLPSSEGATPEDLSLNLRTRTALLKYCAEL